MFRDVDLMTNKLKPKSLETDGTLTLVPRNFTCERRCVHTTTSPSIGFTIATVFTYMLQAWYVLIIAHACASGCALLTRFTSSLNHYDRISNASAHP